jgi:hypothetical protein
MCEQRVHVFTTQRVYVFTTQRVYVLTALAGIHILAGVYNIAPAGVYNEDLMILINNPNNTNNPII